MMHSLKREYGRNPFSNQFEEGGEVQDASCRLCGCSQSLRHVLVRTLAHGRYTWRHNQILHIVLEEAKTACSQANARETAPARRIYFLREGLVTTPQGKEREAKKGLAFQSQRLGNLSRPSRRKAFVHKVLQESGKRPDLVLASTETDSFVMVELTFHGKIGWILAML